MTLDDFSIDKLRDLLVSVAFLENIFSQNITSREGFWHTNMLYFDMHIKRCRLISD